ncbi:MAG: tetratricopeptide repeat protein, partial [Acidiferrobacterales bacterium]
LPHADGRVHDAESHYRQAAAVTPDNATAQFNLGVALEDLGQPDEAIRAYQQAVSLDPEFADAHYNLAHLYERAGNKSAAIRHLVRYKALVTASP